MNIRKKVLVLALVVMAILLPCSAMSNEPLFNTVDVYFTADDIPQAVEGDVLFKIYNETGMLLDTKTFSYTRGTGWFKVTFDVPDYKIGTKFKIQLSEGGRNIVFSGAEQTVHDVETYVYSDGDGNAQYQTAFYMHFVPNWYKKAVITIPGEQQTEYYHSVMGDEVYVTTDLLDKLGIKLTENKDSEKAGFTLSTYTKGYEMKFYMNDIYAVIGGKGLNLDIPVFEMGGMPYVPLSRVAEYFACDYKVVSDDAYTRNISLDMSYYSEPYVKAKFVNEKGISSRTDYLIWISKSGYSVNVFKGSKGKWKWIKSMTCAIGAPSTPTIEGSFEYMDKQSRWQYPGYYCGPIMRFYRGYAIHSTLLYNNGTPMDNRVGVKISHGCIRLRPADINWLFGITPMYTRIYVTG